MSEVEDAFDTWAVVEVMGHQRYAGRVTEQVIGGAAFIRVDVPDVPPVNGLGARQGYTKILGAGSIFAITPCTEEVARRAAGASSGPGMLIVSAPRPAMTYEPDDDDGPWADDID